MRGLIALLLVGCSEYTITGQEDRNPGQDTATPIIDDEPVVEDSGEPDVEAEPVAEAPIYINEGGRLWSWDPEADALESVGNFRDEFGAIDNISDIAINGEGHLFGCTFDALYQIDPETAAATYIGPLEIGPAGLTFVSDDLLIAAGAGVHVIDVATGQTVRTLVEPGGFETAGDIIGLPDGMLYWTVWGGYGDPDWLVVIDPISGELTVRGDTGTDRVFGLGYAQDALYGFTDGGEWVEIDTVFGGLDDRRRFGDAPRWWGATTNPVRW
ncbi:MAG: hypothetical protein AAFV53_35805 [Myxococcota bacterium]